MISEILTFTFFVLIGLEIREGLKRPKDGIFPSICALSGMIFPALIFLLLNPGSRAWAVAMPTDVALAIGALSILGKRINPSIRLLILTLAVADDFFSLIVIGIFFNKDLHVASAIYTLGAATIGFLLPFRRRFIRYLSPLATFIAIPIYIWINLLSKLDFSQASGRIAISVVVARVIGKVFGISLAAFVLIRFFNFLLPGEMKMRDLVGVGFLAGMGLTVSMVIATITLDSAVAIAQVRVGLLLAALVAAPLGLGSFHRAKPDQLRLK